MKSTRTGIRKDLLQYNEASRIAVDISDCAKEANRCLQNMYVKFVGNGMMKKKVFDAVMLLQDVYCGIMENGGSARKQH